MFISFLLVFCLLDVELCASDFRSLKKKLCYTPSPNQIDFLCNYPYYIIFSMLKFESFFGSSIFLEILENWLSHSLQFCKKVPYSQVCWPSPAPPTALTIKAVYVMLPSVQYMQQIFPFLEIVSVLAKLLLPISSHAQSLLHCCGLCSAYVRLQCYV